MKRHQRDGHKVKNSAYSPNGKKQKTIEHSAEPLSLNESPMDYDVIEDGPFAVIQRPEDEVLQIGIANIVKGIENLGIISNGKYNTFHKKLHQKSINKSCF